MCINHVNAHYSEVGKIAENEGSVIVVKFPNEDITDY